MSSAICFNLDQSKILLSGNWLNAHWMTEITSGAGKNAERDQTARM